MGRIHYLSVYGANRIEAADTVPDYSACEDFLQGGREFVWVMYEGKRTCMLVNENGIALSLPINRAATEIYRAWPRKKQMDVKDLHIHGNAMVLEDIAIE
ncbi:hypothetical protein GJ700_02320 [Duganella sp. FT92W]|uniref:Uncharacterized protein n=1 Tax=Pseudoduganella rivuli TaxID=2666085 RepID=A0A7X2IJC4_9BURK|nr:hypothetical protein [Pseudoduganella rivuli]MRV70553.1 hypothetical protein [Pseudoduganella rivuli]